MNWSQIIQIAMALTIVAGTAIYLSSEKIRRVDWLRYITMGIALFIASVCLGYVLYLFGSVIFFGAGGGQLWEP
jgi:TctA family transporter